MKSVILSVVLFAFTCPVLFAQASPDDDSIRVALKLVNEVKLHGAGNSTAVEAMKVLNLASAEQIPAMFEALDESNSISANWIRAAIQKAVAGSNDLQTDSIEAYFRDQSKNAQGRWLAWQIVCQRQPDFRGQTIESLATDPGMPLREIGIAHLLDRAAAFGADPEEMDDAAKEKKLAILESALENARDVEQIQTIAKSMSGLGKEVDLPKHLGLIPAWDLIAGFDNQKEAGFDVVYGPEEVATTLEKKKYEVAGEELSWNSAAADEKDGMVDLNKVIGKKKGVVAYAATTFECSAECTAQVRIGTPNAHKIWINGELVMSNEIYHNSNSIDKFSAPVKLKAGGNKVLVKLCQNEQTEDWAQDWSFQLRFCDVTGKAIR